jgi:hypothetical protein
VVARYGTGATRYAAGRHFVEASDSGTTADELGPAMWTFPPGYPGAPGQGGYPPGQVRTACPLLHASGHDHRAAPPPRRSPERKHLTRAVCSRVRVAGLPTDAGAPVLQGPCSLAFAQALARPRLNGRRRVRAHVPVSDSLAPSRARSLSPHVARPAATLRQGYTALGEVSRF